MFSLTIAAFGVIMLVTGFIMWFPGFLPFGFRHDQRLGHQSLLKKQHPNGSKKWGMKENW
jgi:hypothetical protein